MSATRRFEPRSRARRRALQALYQWLLNPQDMDEIVTQFLEVQDFTHVDTGFFTTVAKGVAARRDTLREQLAEFLDRPWKNLDVTEQVILLMAAWELLYCRDTPHQVVIDEAIDLAHRFGAEQGHSYVNGVLDRAARQWRPDDPAGEPAPGA